MNLAPIVRKKQARHGSEGGVMVAALLITAAATFGFAAWATMIGQRRQGIEQTMGGLQRRLAVESGRQMARQVCYTQRLTLNAGTQVNVSSADSRSTQIHGGVAATSWSGFAMESTSFPTGINHFSPAGTDSAYGVIMNMTLPYSVTDYYPEPTVNASLTTALTAAIQSRSPLLSGDLLVIHRPTLATAASTPAPTITGNLDVVGGRAVFLTTENLSNFATVRATDVSTPQYIVPAANALQTRDPITNQIILPSNFPSPMVTTGSVDSTYAMDPLYRLNVIDSVHNPSNSFKEKIRSGSSMTIATTADVNQSGVTYSTATGVLTIDLTQIGLPSVVVTNNVSEIFITGKTTADQPNSPYTSVGLCYIEDANVSTRSLTKITCNNSDNTRRLIVGVKKIPATSAAQVPGNPVTISFPNSNVAPTWRFLMIAENTPLIFAATGGPGAITLKGGIQTDASITSTTGAGNSVRLIPETDPVRLDRLAPRRGWVETYLDFENGSL